MFTSDTIFQRSPSGREEIYQKKCGLTQSERQVLIVIDGVTPCGVIRDKLTSLTPERIERALATLHRKELILEVLMPLADQQGDEVESAVVERFLQQDPTDPVTIISFDPDDEFGDLLSPSAQPAAPTALAAVTSSLPPPPQIPELTLDAEMPLPTAQEPSTSVMDENLIAQVDMLAAEVRAARREAEQTAAATLSYVPGTADLAQGELSEEGPRMHWGYWLILLGLGCFAAFLWGRLRG